MKPRADKEQTDARVNELLRVMLDGAQQWDFVDFVRQREAEQGSPWFVDAETRQEPLTYSQIRRYVTKAKRLIIASGAPTDRDELLKMHVAKRDALYAKAVAQGDTRSALAILADQARILDLYPARRTEHTGANGDAFFPSLSAMVVAIIKTEQQPTPIVIEDASHEKRSTTGNPATPIGSEEMPGQFRLLCNEPLQDSCIQ